MDAADMTQEMCEKEEREILKRAKLKGGPSSYQCRNCLIIIPEKRRQAVPGVALCIVCQHEREGKI